MSARVGDIVRSLQSGNDYLVEEKIGRGAAMFYGVVDLATGRFPNTFRPHEVEVLDDAERFATIAERIHVERAEQAAEAAERTVR